MSPKSHHLKGKFIFQPSIFRGTSYFSGGGICLVPLWVSLVHGWFNSFLRKVSWKTQCGDLLQSCRNTTHPSDAHKTLLWNSKSFKNLVHAVCSLKTSAYTPQKGKKNRFHVSFRRLVHKRHPICVISFSSRKNVKATDAKRPKRRMSQGQVWCQLIQIWNQKVNIW